MDFQYNLTNNPHKVFIYRSAGVYTCQLPKGITMVNILAIGAGGGGGGGFTRTASPAQAGGGGGGGATGGVNRVMIPKIFLTDSLIVSVGSGGSGGAGGNPAVAGTAGGATSVAVNDSGTVGNAQTYLIIGASGGGGGNQATAAAGGTGGSTTSTASAANINAKAALGEFVGRAGIAGGDGNATTNPLAGVYGTAVIPLSPGRGGGGINAANPGTSANGGSISGRGFVQDVAGGVAPGGNGQNGMFMMKPFVCLGGTGGASHNASDGGNGGAGGPGCGGGGGGAGTSPRPGGTGGRGGDGLVIITCW